MFVLRTLRWCSVIGSSLSHFWNDRTASVFGMFSSNQVLEVAGTVSRHDGENVGEVVDEAP